MRYDMSKVVTECPRHLSSASNTADKKLRRERLTQVDEDGELDTHNSHRSKTGMRPRGRIGWRKDLNDHIMPLLRALRGAVGRPWDDVWSEIVAVLPKGTMGDHVREHVTREVERNVKMVDGVPMVIHYSDGWQPLFSEGRRPQLFVHPDTGILSLAPRPPKVDTRIRKDLYYIPKSTHPRNWDVYIAKENAQGVQWFRIIRTQIPFGTGRGGLSQLVKKLGCAPATNALMKDPEMKDHWMWSPSYTFKLLPCKNPRT